MRNSDYSHCPAPAGVLRAALLRAARQGPRRPLAAPAAGAPVFLSYSHRDAPIAARLRDTLVARGIAVWWDRDLRAGERFGSEIEAILAAATAAIVIWSQHSVASTYVRDEATRALDGGKLVATSVAGFPLAALPLGHGQLHTIGVVDTAGILHALARFGIRPR